MVVVWQGFSAALAVLMSQAHGAGNHRLVGIYLQMGLVFVTVLVAVISVSWIWSGSIMGLIAGIDGDTQERVNTFGRFSLLGILPLGWFYVLNKWLVRAAAAG